MEGTSFGPSIRGSHGGARFCRWETWGAGDDSGAVRL